MISRREFRRYDADLRAISASAETYVNRMLNAFTLGHPGASTEDVREYAVEVMRAAIGYYGDASASRAMNLVLSHISANAPESSGSDPDEEDVRKVVRYQAGKIGEGDIEGFASACSGYVADCVSQRANRAVLESARKSRRRGKGRKAPEIRFARVPTGDRTCTFCVMLASRGFVYWTRATAGAFDRYHRNCRCRIVPATEESGLEGYDPAALYDLWQELEEIDSDDSLTASEKTARKAVAARRATEGPPVVYEKPRSEFLATDDGIRDLAAHEALRAAGYSVVARAEDAPEGYSNIDLLLDGELCEVKSPITDATGTNAMRFIERNLRKAVKQFKKVYGGYDGEVAVVLNCMGVHSDRESIIKRIRLELSRHPVDRVILITGSGDIDDIHK